MTPPARGLPRRPRTYGSASVFRRQLLRRQPAAVSLSGAAEGEGMPESRRYPGRATHRPTVLKRTARVPSRGDSSLPALAAREGSFRLRGIAEAPSIEIEPMQQ